MPRPESRRLLYCVATAIESGAVLVEQLAQMVRAGATLEARGDVCNCALCVLGRTGSILSEAIERGTELMSDELEELEDDDGPDDLAAFRRVLDEDV